VTSHSRLSGAVRRETASTHPSARRQARRCSVRTRPVGSQCGQG